MESQPKKTITILGAGAWGTAIALHLARQGHTVKIWSHEVEEVAAMLAERCNERFLPGFPFPDNIAPTANLADAINDVQDIIIAIPSVGFRDTVIILKTLLAPEHRISCVSKGLDADTGMLLSQVAEEVLGNSVPYAAISGPSFAQEVAQDMPTSVVVASKNDALRNDMMQAFNSKHFATFPSDDVIGVQIGSVVKNIIAIATGIFDGMQFGANARSALLTHGLTEMAELSQALGGKAETIYGLAGVGDLILTATDNQSRNRRFGLALGEGKSIEEAEAALGHVVEGKRNAEMIAKLAADKKVHLPICQTIWELLQGKITTQEAVDAMLAWKK